VVLNGNVSAWLYVISGVTQGSILWLLLFLVFINDIDKGPNRLLKFADDTKLVGTVSNDLEIEQLRSDLKQLYDWSIDWQMLFNINKCKVLHFGYRNVHSIILLVLKYLRRRMKKRTWGPLNQSLKSSSSQCVVAAKAANRTLGMINRTFVNVVFTCFDV